MNGKEIKDAATMIARRYKKKCWWADVDDLTNEGVVAIMKALPNWDPEVGVPVEAYVCRAAAFAIKHYLWQNSSPVSASSHQEKNLRSIHRCTLAMTNDMKAAHDPQQGYADAEWRWKVKAKLEEIIAASPDGDLAAAVLLEERKPAEMDADVQQVYRAAAVLRNRIRQSYPLYKLWKEMRQ